MLRKLNILIITVQEISEFCPYALVPVQVLDLLGRRDA